MAQASSRPSALAGGAPPSAPSPPAVDDHLVPSGSLYELIDGEKIPVPPVGVPHSRAHFDLITLLGAHVAPGYLVGVDLLTRVDASSEVAPDACVYPEERDEQGHRKLEELAFEVLATERRPHAARKAKLLVERGVRRVFAIDLGWSQVLEWDSALQEGKGDWRLLVPGTVIEDQCLVRPLSTNALRGAARVSHEVLEGWVKKGHPVLEREVQRGKDEGLREGKTEGLREAIRDLCEVLGVELDEARVSQLEGLDLAALEALRAQLKNSRRWPG